MLFSFGAPFSLCAYTTNASTWVPRPPIGGLFEVLEMAEHIAEIRFQYLVAKYNILQELLFHSLAECLRILRPKFFEVLWQLLDDVRDFTRIAMVSENCKDVSDGAFRGYGVWKMS